MGKWFGYNKRIKNAFSLVERSIALVIFGLLVGDVLAEQWFIRAAELRRVVTQEQQFVDITHSFRDKYFALPGDITRATSFRGLPDPVNYSTTAGTGTQACNGRFVTFLACPTPHLR